MTQEFVDKREQETGKDYSEYLDSEPRYFDGDIIITDPYYIIRRDDRCDEFTKRFENALIHDTICGSWNCTTYDINTKKILGTFCADIGEVGVFLLSDVLEYNPDYDDPIEYPSAVTLIKNFRGIVQIVVERQTGTYEFDISHYKKGDEWEHFYVHVIGKGINSETGEPIEFRTEKNSLWD